MRWINSLDWRNRSGLGVRLISSPNAMLRRTESHGYSEYDWNTMPRSAPGEYAGLPSTKTSPSLGLTRPAAMLNSVDLPQPDGPTIQANCPSGTVNEICCTARTSPRRVG